MDRPKSLENMEKQLSTSVLVLGIIIAVVRGQGQYHTSDPIGNFQVAYTASDGHYLVEDRSADGTALLGNFGYRSSGGEQVGVAYGSDGAGFVIRAPSATSGQSSFGAASQGGGYRPSQSSGHYSSGGGNTYNTASIPQDPYLRYQAVNYPSSNPATSSDITSYSSLPANDITSAYSTQTASSAYQQQHDAGQSHSASYSALPSSSSSSHSSYSSYPLSYSSQTNYRDINPPSTSFHSKIPFSYSFSSYNDPYAPRYRPQPQQYIPQYSTPAPQLTTVTPQLPTVSPQQFSYQQAAPNLSLDQLAAQLQAQQREHAQIVSQQAQYQAPSSTRHTYYRPGASSLLNYSFGTQLPIYGSLYRPYF